MLETAGSTSSARTRPSSVGPRRLVAAAEGGHGAGPELLADDSGPLEHLPLERVEAVQPGGEEGLNRRRQRDELHRRPRLVGEHGDELLGVERISLCHIRDARAELRREDPAAVERIEKLRRVVGGERLEPHERAFPPRALLEQLLPRHAEQQDRRIAAPAADVLDEIEQRRLGPVDVFQEHEQRLRPRPVSRTGAARPTTAPPPAWIRPHRARRGARPRAPRRARRPSRPPPPARRRAAGGAPSAARR